MVEYVFVGADIVDGKWYLDFGGKSVLMLCLYLLLAFVVGYDVER